MPGMIDAHVHVNASFVNLSRTVRTPQSYLAHFAAHFLRSTLDRGFTTVRDVGGADIGLANAARDGLFVGSRLYYGGKIISQSGGHGDMRPGDLEPSRCCGCSDQGDQFTTIVDGADAMRRAVREELRRGASHVKLMASGGVTSPTDPIDRSQYSDDEIRAAVDETTRAGKYIAAHCHPPKAIARCAALGVRSIEHATMIDEMSAQAVARAGAYAVPTMAIIFSLLDEGEKLGLPAVSMEKLQRLSQFALAGLEVMKRANVKMGFGTDLLGSLHTRQCDEFILRARVEPPIDTLRSACSINAEIIGEQGRLGCIREGALADLLVVNGNPLEDISLLADAGRRLAVIMLKGRLHRVAAELSP